MKKSIIILTVLLLVGSFFVMCGVEPNEKPTATDVTITGTMQVGNVLTGNYTYSDTEDDEEGTSTFRWLSSDTETGTFEAITDATATTYTPTEAGWIKFEVTPVAKTGEQTGDPVLSDAVEITVATACADPTFSVAEGNVDPDTTVEMTSTAGCTIYYEVGTNSTPADPSSGSTEYTGAVNIGSTLDDEVTFKAIAIDGTGTLTQSNIAEVTYTIYDDSKCLPPVFDPASGTVTEGTEIAITTGSTECTIYYTQGDGSQAEPTGDSSEEYDAGAKPTITTGNQTIKAVAIDNGGTLNDSDVVTASYGIGSGDEVTLTVYHVGTGTGTTTPTGDTVANGGEPHLYSDGTTVGLYATASVNSTFDAFYTTEDCTSKVYYDDTDNRYEVTMQGSDLSVYAKFVLMGPPNKVDTAVTPTDTQSDVPTSISNFKFDISADPDDPDNEPNELTFDFYFGEQGSIAYIDNYPYALSGENYLIDAGGDITVEAGKTYEWRVDARDPQDNVTTGDVFTFTTASGGTLSPESMEYWGGGTIWVAFGSSGSDIVLDISQVNNTDFTITINSNSVNVTGVTMGSNDYTIEIATDGTGNSSDPVTVDFSGGPIVDTPTGNECTSFSLSQ